MKYDIHLTPNKEELDESASTLSSAGETEFQEATAGSAPDKQSLTRSQRSSEEDDMNATGTRIAVSVHGDEPGASFFSSAEAQSFRSLWQNVQVGFVDDPRNSVEQASRLVADTVKHLTQGFSTECRKLEQQWGRGDSISTEDLRLLLRHYRSFFERLVSI